MTCLCPSPLDLARLAAKLRDGARLMVGQGDYAAYAAHMRARHPDAAPLSPADYFRAREEARFGAGGERGFRCC